MRVTVLGAGMMGLCSAMLLARDGHEVTVVERDGSPAVAPDQAWEAWNRRGVNQFRLAHFFLSRFRAVVEEELPDLARAIEAAGGLRFNFLANMPDAMKGGARPDDDRFDTLTGRRCVVEAVTAAAAESTPGVTIRRGAGVAGLVGGATTAPGVPHVVGVELETGEKLEADLVVDATGRRSPLPRWLSELGAAPVVEDGHDSGFVYFGRHFTSPSGALPVMIGPPKQEYGSITSLTLPADNGTWSVTLVASSRDSALRALAEPECWAAAVSALPLAAHWLDGEPIDSKVSVMAKIEDRIRDFAPNGEPVATGVLPVADSWACTNPSLGRGASIGVQHAVALRDLLRRSDGDPARDARDWYATTAETVAPWYRATEYYDRHRLAEVQAIIDGRPYEPGEEDEEWHLTRVLDASAGGDADLIRAFLETGMVLRTPGEIFATGIGDRLRTMAATHQPSDPFGPSRAELLAAIAR